MQKQLSKLVLLVALLVTFVVSGAPAFAASKSCTCLNLRCFGGKSCPQGGCQFDKKTSQCVNTGCKGSCLFI